MRRGIVLAGGSGTRLHPVTQAVSKQLLPVYDKPMVFYPISLLMLAGIQDILIISTPQDTPRFQQLLQDGRRYGLNLSYAIQASPDGLAQAFIIGSEFLGNHSSALVLGDNVFYGHDLSRTLQRASQQEKGATVFAYPVQDPERYGVVELGDNGKAVSLQEKPINPRSHYAVTGLYFYDENVTDVAKTIKPSSRGELEITDVNNWYLQRNLLNVEVLSRGMAWFDMGTHDSLLQASMFIETIENRQGLKIACLEEIAYRQGFVDLEQLRESAEIYQKSNYGRYLQEIIERVDELDS